MSATLLLQRSHAAAAAAAVASSRQQLFDSSLLRFSSLQLRGHGPSHGRSGDLSIVARSSPVKRRDVSSGAAVRSGLKEFLTSSDKHKVTETLEFYVHEIRSADPSDTTATLKFANLPPNTKPLEWGCSVVFDNEVREGSGADSTLLGRERGWGFVTAKEGKKVQLISKISFTDGKYKGSTLTFSGNVGGEEPPYELIVLGGSGHFRGAQGYVLAESAPNEGGRYKFHWKVFVSK